MEKKSEVAEKRLWIGNLDIKAGQSRGYAFVTYKTKQNASTAIQMLTGKKIDGRAIAVGLAKTFNEDEADKTKAKIEIPALAGPASSSASSTVDKKRFAIMAIEAKLKTLESQRSGDDFEVNKSVSEEASLIQRYQFNKGQERNQRNTLPSRHRPRHKPSRPYNRHSKR
ncbi:hypothetical protein DMENIID0001_048890 [Sergentomyia squamirostris]